MKGKYSLILLGLVMCILPVAGSDNALWDLINKGMELYYNESYTAAKKCFEDAISINPSSPEAWYGKGCALNGEALEEMDPVTSEGISREAKKCFERALQINPNYAEAYMDLAWTELTLDNNEEALIAIDKSLNINPNYSEAINVKGKIMFCMGRYDEAIELFDKALTIDPNNKYAWYNKGEALKEKNDMKGAAEAYEKWADAGD